MKNRETIASLRLIQFLILSFWIIYGLGLIAGVKYRLESPKEIYIPVALDLNLEQEGQIQYNNIPPLDVKISNIEGIISYKENNPENAPIAWADLTLILIKVGLYLFIFFLAYKIIQTSINQEPFTMANANKMKWIGYSFILLALVKFLDSAIGLAILEEHLTSKYIDTTNCFSQESVIKLVVEFLLSEITIGFFALFVAALFKHGIELREENDLTI